MPAKKRTPASAAEPAPSVVESAVSERLQLKRLLASAASADTEKDPTQATPRGRTKSKVKCLVEAYEEEPDSPAETLEASSSKGRGGRRSVKKVEEVSPIEETSKNSASEKSSNTRVMRSTAQANSKTKQSDFVESKSDSEDSHSPVLIAKKSKQKEKVRKIEPRDESLSEDQSLQCPNTESKEQPPANTVKETKTQKRAIDTETEESKSLSLGPNNKKIAVTESSVSAVRITERSPVLLKLQIQHPTSDRNTGAVNEKLSFDSKARSSMESRPPLASSSKMNAVPLNPFAGSKAISSKPPMVDSAVSRLWVEDISAVLQKSKVLIDLILITIFETIFTFSIYCLYETF